MKYTETHEWIKLEKEIGTVGITLHAQKELGDIVFVEMPRVGKEVKQGQEAAVLESTKAAADLYAPVSGVIVEVNARLQTEPQLINQSPETGGWIFKIRLTNPTEMEELMDQKAYEALIQP